MLIIPQEFMRLREQAGGAGTENGRARHSRSWALSWARTPATHGRPDPVLGDLAGNVNTMWPNDSGSGVAPDRACSDSVARG